MPWHAGGPHELTVGEIHELVAQKRVAVKKQQAEAAKSKRRR